MSRQLSKDLRNVPKLQKLLKSKPESYWIKRGETMALQLFHEMAERVPAYKDFLKQRNINHRNIRTIDDFKTVPTIDKDNYLRQYPRQDLCWDGEFSNKRWVVSRTSGSSGEPFYFPRTDLQDEYYAITAELYLRENFKIHERKTLYIDAFAMGAWIGGLFTYEAIHRVAQKGYPLSIITTSIDKAEVINSVRKLGADFDQVIIGCYPPIMRDIIDLGVEEGLDWGNYNLGVIFSAEGFSEQFRDYVADYGKLANIYTSSLNHYGTVDLGTMSHETPTSILVRRQANDNKQLHELLLPRINKQPTLTQYLPEMFYFESVEGNVICSSYSGLPLVRYYLKDHGGVLTMNEVEQAYIKTGHNLPDELKVKDIQSTKWNLPFVYVSERGDFSVNLIGIVIYPEGIHRGLLTNSLPKSITGKFMMEIVYDKKLSQSLVIHIELRRNKLKTDKVLSQKIQKAVVASLLKDNSEYIAGHAVYGKKLWPKIKLWSYEHPTHFSGRGKQVWVKK